jgi:hypothetical protein
MPQSRRREPTVPHRGVDAVLPAQLDAVVVRRVVADQEQLAQCMFDRERAVDDVARVRVDAVIAGETRLDDQLRTKAERGAVRSVVLVQRQQRGDRAAQLDRARRIEVLAGIAEHAAPQRDAAAFAWYRFGQEQL